MDVFGSLVGEWTFTRTFEPGIGSMTGAARFRPLADDVLHYHEDGILELTGGHRGEAWREYHYVLDDDTISIRFLDGRTLHVLRPHADGVADDVHLCGADTYTGRYRFRLPARFTVDMTVTGPAKDYSTHTTYERHSIG